MNQCTSAVLLAACVLNISWEYIARRQRLAVATTKKEEEEEDCYDDVAMMLRWCHDVLMMLR